MKIKEIKAEKLNVPKFIETQTRRILRAVGNQRAINALSGGVDSTVTTILAHKALGDKLTTYFIENGLMREGEAKKVLATFKRLGIPVEIINAKKSFLKALEGVEDPEEKREAITQTFYKDVFGKAVVRSGATFLFQGSIYTDVEETVAGIKRQHNVLAQLGIDTQKQFGYKVIEPIIQLRKDGVRKLARELGLPVSVWNRMPFPGPALAARIIGAVTQDKLDIVRKATAITENRLKGCGAFQYMAILHNDLVTGIKNGKRLLGNQIEIRCWDSIDATKATPTQLSWKKLFGLADDITNAIPEVVSVTYNITSKGPSTMEAV